MIILTSLLFSVYLQEVGSIIGKKGEIVNRFREEVSKANIDTKTKMLILTYTLQFFTVWCQN